MMTFRCAYISIILMIPFFGWGQYVSKFSGVSEAAQFYNPASVGDENALSVLAGAKYQWVNWEGAPKTQYISVHSLLKNRRIGVGLFATNESIGLNRFQNYMGKFSYRINTGYGKLSMGVALGYTTSRLDFSRIIQTHSNDGHLIYSTDGIQSSVQYGFGINYRKDRYYLNVSCPYSLLRFEKRNFILQSGYKLFKNQSHELEISILYKRMALIRENQIEINGLYTFKRMVIFGLGIRQYGDLSLLAGVNIHPKWKLMYAHDIIMAQGLSQTGGSHEIMLKFNLKDNVSTTSPRQF